ncbi:MAG: hypothetical protein ACR2P8_06420 [Myxococcota bacterium]
MDSNLEGEPMSLRRRELRIGVLLCIWSLIGCTTTYFDDGDGSLVDSRGQVVDEKQPGENDLDSESNAEATEEEMVEDAVDDAER